MLGKKISWDNWLVPGVDIAAGVWLYTTDIFRVRGNGWSPSHCGHTPKLHWVLL
jgi:hypothetical protein